MQQIVAVTDRHSAYFVLDFLNHQVCLAHLLRELEYLTELDERKRWSKDVANLFHTAIHQRNVQPEEAIEKKPWIDRLDELLKENQEPLGQTKEQAPSLPLKHISTLV